MIYYPTYYCVLFLCICQQKCVHFSTNIMHFSFVKYYLVTYMRCEMVVFITFSFYVTLLVTISLVIPEHILFAVFTVYRQVVHS